MAICLLNDIRVLINFNRKPRCLEGVQLIPVEFQHCARPVMILISDKPFLVTAVLKICGELDGATLADQ